MAKTHMDWLAFEKTAEWQKLSVRQKFWLQTYLFSGNDQVFATQQAYETSDKYTRTFSYEVIKQKKIQAALDRYFNKSPRQIFINRLEHDIKIAKPGSFASVMLQETLARAKFGTKIPKTRKSSKTKSKGKSNGHR